MSNKLADVDTPARRIFDYIQMSIGAQPVSNWGVDVGISPSLLSRWKNGRTKRPSLAQLEQVAAALGDNTTVQELLVVAGMDRSDAEPRQPTSPVTTAEMILRDPDLTDEQKRLLLGMHEVFRSNPKK